MKGLKEERKRIVLCRWRENKGMGVKKVAEGGSLREVVWNKEVQY